jgi:hypothetical protein
VGGPVDVFEVTSQSKFNIEEEEEWSCRGQMVFQSDPQVALVYPAWCF